ncbi:MAG: GxxExxY protein [Bacteroidetes bacterium]|nr:MAG: GxxExxY protein [Bacteroidota bacterium]
MTENELARIIVDTAFKLHDALGPGLLESVYQEVFAFKLRERGLSIETEVSMPVIFEGRTFSSVFRVDILVERKVVVELKSVESLQPVHAKQVLTYLRLSGCRLGLLINFGSAYIKQGIKRVVNGLDDEAAA